MVVVQASVLLVMETHQAHLHRKAMTVRLLLALIQEEAVAHLPQEAE